MDQARNASGGTQGSAPRAVVLLAACNGAEYLVQQVDSILQQRGVQVSIVCSVDFSMDATLELLTAYARRDSRVAILPVHERFGAAAPNFFRLMGDSDLTQVDIVAYSDQDDIWLPEKLLRAWQCMQVSGAAGYSSNCMAFWADGRATLLDKAQPQRKWDHFFEAAGPGCTYVISATLASALQQRIRTCNVQLAGVDYHDWLTYAFARHNGYIWHIDKQAHIHYRQHAANQLGANVGWRSFRRRVLALHHGYGHDQAIKVARAIGAQNHPVVQRGLLGGRWGYLWLALQARGCRRRLGDQWLFVVANIWMAMRNPRSGKTPCHD